MCYLQLTCLQPVCVCSPATTDTTEQRIANRTKAFILAYVVYKRNLRSSTLENILIARQETVVVVILQFMLIFDIRTAYCDSVGTNKMAADFSLKGSLTQGNKLS